MGPTGVESDLRHIDGEWPRTRTGVRSRSKPGPIAGQHHSTNRASHWPTPLRAIWAVHSHDEKRHWIQDRFLCTRSTRPDGVPPQRLSHPVWLEGMNDSERVFVSKLECDKGSDLTFAVRKKDEPLRFLGGDGEYSWTELVQWRL